MALSIYVGKDNQGQSWTPDHAHEIEGLLDILTRLWKKYHHLQEHYCILANIKSPDADVIVLGEHGIGVLELKHYPGQIRIDSDGRWTSDEKQVRSGSHPNPHKQVQSYASELRGKIFRLVLPEPFKRQPDRWNEIKTQTAVCFTHPDVNLNSVLSKQNSWNNSKTRAVWEDSFNIIQPAGISEWVFKLRFGTNQGRSKNFEPIQIKPELQTRCAELVLGGKEWQEVRALMPSSEPYAYVHLHLTDKDYLTFPLLEERVTIGRGIDCDIVVPRQFKRVSQQHCEIVRSPGSISLQNLHASNGTFVNGKPLTQPYTLRGEEIITLGNAVSDEKSCKLRFELSKGKTIELSRTEV